MVLGISPTMGRAFNIYPPAWFLDRISMYLVLDTVLHIPSIHTDDDSPSEAVFCPAFNGF